jgi:hypothetical protein
LVARSLLPGLFFLIAFSIPALAQSPQLLTVSRTSAKLRTVDPVSGDLYAEVTITLANENILGATGLAKDPTTGTIYALLRLQGANARRLVTLDTATGTATNIGPADDGSGADFSDITFGNDGTLFGVTGDGSSSAPETLFTINKTNGSATFLKTLGNGDGGEAIAFHPLENVIYHQSGGHYGYYYSFDDPILETIDPANLAAEPVNIPLYLSTPTEAASLAYFRDDYFLWADTFDNLWLLRSDGKVAYVSNLGYTATGMVVIGNFPSCPSTAALFGTAPREGPSLLYSLDPANGAASLIGPTGFSNISAIEFGNNGVLYAAATRTDYEQVRVLITVDPCTGKGTELAQTFPITAPLKDLAARDSDGAMFAVSLFDTLLAVDPVTGTLSTIGQTEFADDSGLAFDTTDSLYFGRVFDFIGTLFSLDPATAETLQTRSLSLPSGVMALHALDTDPADGKLFAVLGVEIGNGKRLATISSATGAVTVLGSTNSSISSLAFRSGTTPAQFRLKVTKLGNGAGTVTSNPAAIDCGNTCEVMIGAGATVTLTAAPAPGFEFIGWGGACSGTADCALTMDADRNVSATFRPPQRTLTVIVTPSPYGGSVTIEPGSLVCGFECVFSFDIGSVVTIAPNTPAGAVFGGWSQDCTGANACNLTMDADHHVSALFADDPATIEITLSLQGGGSGSVTSTPPGVNCSTTVALLCSLFLPANTSITLNAAALPGSAFTGWGGACGGAGACILPATQNHFVTATFLTSPPPSQTALTITNTGLGSVTTNPGGFSCGGALCTFNFALGTVVALTATPAPGSIFSHWTGDCGGNGSCTVTMSAARNVGAVFSSITPTNFTVNVGFTGTGSGSITSTPAGINCPNVCLADFPAGTVVALTAVGATGSVFSGWNGDCSGTGACTITVNANRSVTATFTTAPTITLSPGPNSLVTVAPGQSATFTLTLTPFNGITGNVTFACTSGLPPFSTCSFAPPSSTIGNSPLTTVLTITTRSRTAMASSAPLSPLWMPFAILFAAAGLGAHGRKRRTSRLCLVMLLVILLPACGGGGSNTTTTTQQQQSPTPSGTYVVTVSATVGNVTQFTTVTVTVQ